MGKKFSISIMRHVFVSLLTAFLLCAASWSLATEFADDLFSPYLLAPNIDDSHHDLSIFSGRNRTLYHKVFQLQRNADWRQANKNIAKIDNPILMGHVIFQRLMHPTGYRSEFAELADWLEAYADHPGAGRVYRLARKRRSESNTRKLMRPTRPAKITLQAVRSSDESTTIESKIDKPSRAVRAIQWQVKQNISRGWVSSTWNLLRRPTWRNELSDQEYVHSLGDIAKGYVIHDADAKAITVADEALRVDANYPSQAYWWAGLAAWRLGDYSSAAEFFTFLGSHPEASPDVAAAASFWVWRTELRRGNVTQAHQALIQASQDLYSFYGQLARYALSIPDGFDWQLRADNVRAQVLGKTYPALQRILALAEVGEYARAQAEIARLRYDETQEHLATLTFVADRAGMANFVLKLGRKQIRAAGTRHSISRYPLPRWKFHDSYSIDRALLYAVIHKESQFIAEAKSSVGARGLMQIMPSTARMMQKRLELPRGNYQDSPLNLIIGQEYLRLLLTLPEINYNLIYTLAGYNAGPGRLRDWRDKLKLENDPLLFIEIIPVRETRHYIKIVLSNLWIYRKRLNQETPSLTMILEGKWPLYQRLDGRKSRQAAVQVGAVVEPSSNDIQRTAHAD
ncbi:MAG: transglycosylase SLT domain-containing protein [Alphaproteobacteria bacterium]|nr:transglycosylase SLT domain-containing protein [Alphaproteobacteria bacterium]